MARRKTGSRRIDAALDAMRPYGFSGNLVRETVKELLDVYGGDSGWIFVEEASYTLLIEAILEKQRDVVPMVGQEIDEEALPIAGPSHLNEVSCSVAEAADVDVPLLTHKLSDSPSQTTEEALPIEGPSHLNEVSFSVPAAVGLLPLLTHKVSDSPSQTTDPGGDVEALQSRIPAAQSTPRSQRRKPYYGWISSDNEEEDLVDLLPAHTNEELSKLFNLSGKQKKHKTRWDVEPEDY